MQFPTKFVLILICIASATVAKAQIGGNATYRFLDIPVSARPASLGGAVISVKDHDPSMALQNPALLNAGMANTLNYNFGFYYSGINLGYAAYTFDKHKYGTFQAGLQYFAYSEFIKANESGEHDFGPFAAADYAFNVAWGRQIDSTFSIGANVKTLYSNYQEYKSIGLAADLGVHYQFRHSNLALAFVVKNLGSQLKPYTAGNYESLPLDVQFGISRKLSKAPLRFSVVFHHLQSWHLRYPDPQDPLAGGSSVFGSAANKQESTSDKIFSNIDNALRHTIFGAEFLLTKNVNFRLGYNYQRMRELRLADKLGTVGISYGLSLKIYKFQIQFARATYHLAGGTNTFSIVTNLHDFSKKAAK